MFSAQVKALMQQLADLLTKRVDAEDGGPGSGNWGHKGRPGEVGGSGKGGGNQYRGGKKNILYTSSKRDWLNGLTGEKQQKATKFMQSMEKLKRPGQDTEVFIMRNGTSSTGASAVKEYLDLKGEARGWDKYAYRMIRENLDEDDKAVVNALRDKYGQVYQNNSTLPDDRDTSLWDADDLRTWNDLKSKAMIGPTSGMEPSDELLIAAGLKEAPKPKAPTTNEENDHWMDGLSEKMQERLKKQLRKNLPSYLQRSPVSETEQSAVHTIGKDKQKADDFNGYLNAKETFLGADVFSAISKGEPVGTLGIHESRAFCNSMEFITSQLNSAYGTALKFPDDVEKIEKDLLQCEDYAAESYLKLKAMALGLNDYDTAVDVVRNACSRLDDHAMMIKQRAVAKKNQDNFKRRTYAERVKAIDACKSVHDVAETLKDNGIMAADAKINLQGVDASLAKDAALSYNMVAEKFPFMAGEWHGLRTSPLRDGVYARAYIASDGRTIELSTKEYADVSALKDSYKECVETGFHPKGTDYRSIVTHEIGHTLDGYLSKKGVAGSELEFTREGNIKKGVSFASILKKRVCKELKVKLNDQETIKSMLSGYGAYKNNDQEWFAECFAEAMHSPNPRPMAATMMKHLTQILKEEGLISG